METKLRKIDYYNKTYLMEQTPLPDWIIDQGFNRYSIDVNAAIKAGETLPIELWKIPQFAGFFTNPPEKFGSIYFENYKQ